MSKILITGGAGFIGTHLVNQLYDKGYKIIVYDNLSPQVHGNIENCPKEIKDKVEFIKADIRDKEKLKIAVCESNIIIHLVSETGVGQSMYEVERYSDVIINGTAILWDILANEKHNVKKVVLSSSRAVYGEGKYICKKCGQVYPKGRYNEDLSNSLWEPRCPKCKEFISPTTTDELSQLNPTSIYAIGKRTQEEISLVMGNALNIPTTIIRYQNVYGLGQSMTNPYTGILSIFTSRLKNGKPIQVYEDGLESRDFVYVKDVVNGTILAMENSNAAFEIFNIGNGEKTTVMDIANILTKYINPNLKPLVTGQYRMGDIRHCIADITKAKKLLNYIPNYNIDEGIKEFLEWTEKQEIIDMSEKAEKELKDKGMLK